MWFELKKVRLPHPHPTHLSFCGLFRQLYYSELIFTMRCSVVLMVFLNSRQARVSCEVLVNTNNQTIEHQDCYPEVKIHHAAHFCIDISYFCLNFNLTAPGILFLVYAVKGRRKLGFHCYFCDTMLKLESGNSSDVAEFGCKYQLQSVWGSLSYVGFDRKRKW